MSVARPSWLRSSRVEHVEHLEGVGEAVLLGEAASRRFKISHAEAQRGRERREA